MHLKKRGLGRGLEALLANVPLKDDSNDAEDLVVSRDAQDLSVAFQADREQPSLSADGAMSNDQADTAMALINSIHRERLNLLEEAEALNKLIDEFELIVGASLAG